MANIKSAKKRALTNEKRRLRNKMVKTNLKTTEKQFLAAVAEGDVEKAQSGYRLASKKFDMAASKGIIHKNAANRKKSKLAKKLNAMA
ncbi:MAG: 30S ribosomal protein S20 [Eubacteriaceae bacterium]|nr:30S ribosomal protein S20 [Eubacteriaceae bacterium]